MVSRTISFLACVAVLGSALFMAGCAKPSSTTTTCNSGQLECGGSCASVQTDNLNCGACGTVCQSGQSCQAGKCTCSSGMLCGSSCVTSDANHCGSCTTVCPSSSPVCDNNQCSSSCSAGQTQCGTACTTTTTDSNNCGSCGTVCPAGATCSGGQCGCSGGGKLCGTSCVNTSADNNNCGNCGTVCGSGKNCSNGVCMTTSTTGTGGSGTGTGGTTGTGGSGTGTGGSGTGTGGSGTGTGGSGTGTGGSGTGTGGSGTGTGGSGTGTGGSGSGANPPGYYMTKDWNVTSVDWHGCVWTGVDSTVSGSTTSVTPQDFTAASKEGGPYEVSGTVYNDYNAVALLGFNLNEATTGSSTQCKYNAAAATQAGPPVGTIPSSATGIAVNWSQKMAPPTSFRIQIQAADGATNANDRWCATITDAQGPSFIPFTSFYPQCWNVGTTMSPGTAYAKQAIDAVVFLVPGTVAEKAPFDFTIIGFAPGTSKADAPGGAAACGTSAGTVGSSTASDAASFQRAAVTGTDCKTYIVQNNNWGNPTGSSQVVNYSGTGFTVASSTGSGSSAPASFPSTYVGANGNVANGTYNTWADTGLPKQISSISSAMTSFGWSGGKSGGQFNATYDVWFAKTQPTAGSYNDGISGFIMVWINKPSNFHPIGNSIRSATIANNNWDVWVGPRGSGQGSTGGVSDGSGRPVISYVIHSGSIPSLSFDLKDFISDAVSHGSTDMSGGASGITQAFSSSWYLTDVFAGFEIWTGSDATGLKSTGLTFKLQ